MKKLSFAIVGAATLALAACDGKREEATENVDTNVVENLEAAANDVANESATLENQANALNAEANTEAPASETDDSAADVNAM